MTESLSERLWSNAVEPDCYAGGAEKYQAAALEQYKLYVDMADKVSARRALANTFFLALNTAALTVVGVFLQTKPQAASWLLIFPVLALLTQCGA